MLVSHTKKFIFIHIYKTAGTSISLALAPFSDYSFKSKNPIKRINYLTGRYPKFHSRTLHSHSKAREIKNELGNKYDDYYSFCFVRNPWDWQVSLYKYMLKDQTHHQHEFIRTLGGFDSYIDWRCNNEIRLQSDFIFDQEGNKIVDFVGKFESLENDFNLVLSKLGIKKMKLPHLNISRQDDYRDYYSTETSDMVKHYFKQDIEMFGYEF